MGRNLVLQDASNELENVHKPISTYRLIDTDIGGPTIGDCTIGFISNQFSGNLKPDDERFDWRIFTMDGRQIQPWICTERHTLDEVLETARNLDPALFDTKAGVLIEAETTMGMKGYLCFDSFNDFYFSNYPTLIRFDEYKRAFKRYTDANQNPVNRFDGSKRPATLVGDTVHSINVKFF